MARIDLGGVRRRADLLAKLAADPDLDKALDILETSLRRGGKILVFGNGGSATQASHFAAELVNRFGFDRPALAAVALTCDPAILTSIANDDGFHHVFSRQIEALGRPGDAVLGLTTSGASANVLEGVRAACRLGLDAVALSGKRRDQLDGAGARAVVAVDSGETPVVQEMHLFLLHVLADNLEHDLYGGST